MHERTLAAFLAGDLDERAAAEFDAHLLTCAECWRAVREDRAGRAAAARLRDPVPFDLADRVRGAVEQAARPHRRPQRARLVAAAAVAAALALVAVVLPDRSDPPVITAVVEAAERIPATTGLPDAGPVAFGERWTVRAGVTELRSRYYRLDGVELLVARSDRPLATPHDARPVSPGAMPWTIDRDGITVYCVHDDLLIAAAVPADRLIALAERLPES